MKKFISVLSALCIAAALTSCGGEPQQEPVPPSESTETENLTEETAQEEKNQVEDIVIDYEIDPSKPVIALTFDDGPNTTTTNQVLDLLQKYKVKASFFLIGNNINEQSAQVVKRAYDMGCEINNHSKTHSYMNEMSAEDIAAEVKFVSDKVEEITGEPTKFFRPPYIAVNDTMYQNIDMPFISGVGCNDWDPEVSVDTRIKRVRRQVQDGIIILLHDAEGNSGTVEALDTLIPDLLSKGYQFATVSELFRAKGVEISGDDTQLYSVVG